MITREAQNNCHRHGPPRRILGPLRVPILDHRLVGHPLKGLFKSFSRGNRLLSVFHFFSIPVSATDDLMLPRKVPIGPLLLLLEHLDNSHIKSILADTGTLLMIYLVIGP